jgi:hypothetical protein
MSFEEFPFINVPESALPITGEPTEGTRLYRREGSDEECAEWFEELGNIFQGDVGLSPGGVTMFVPVSRAAVHKRLREGRLTGFTFYVTSQANSFFGKPRKIKQRPYIALSVSECKAWAEELKRRGGYVEEPGASEEKKRNQLRAVASNDEPQSLEEIEEDNEFVEKDPKDKKSKGVVYKQPITREQIIDIVQMETMIAVEAALAKLLPGKLGEKHRKRVQNGNLEKSAETKNKWKWKE